MNKKQLIVTWVAMLLFLSGCATYSAQKDPVYHAYLNGEISYAEYVDHYHRLMAGQRARARAFQEGMQGVADGMSSPERKKYQIKDEHGNRVGSMEEEY